MTRIITNAQALWLSGQTPNPGSFRKYSILAKFSVIAILLFGLSGCFKSNEELISADNADFPFKTITYAEAGDQQKITFKRVGDSYLSTKEGEKDSVRFKKFGENLYVAQLTTIERDKPLYLYALVKVAPDRKSFELIKSIAETVDLAAAGEGKSGLNVCEEEFVCVSILKNYFEYARDAPPTDSINRFQIQALDLPLTGTLM